MACLNRKGKSLPFEINGGLGYLYPLPESQGDNAAIFGSSSPPPTIGLHRFQVLFG